MTEEFLITVAVIVLICISVIIGAKLYSNTLVRLEKVRLQAENEKKLASEQQNNWLKLERAKIESQAEAYALSGGSGGDAAGIDGLIEQFLPMILQNPEMLKGIMGKFGGDGKTFPEQSAPMGSQP